jgi:hypothetical protein
MFRHKRHAAYLSNKQPLIKAWTFLVVFVNACKPTGSYVA